MQVTLNAALAALAQCGRVHEMRDLFADCSPLAPDEISYNMLLGALVSD